MFSKPTPEKSTLLKDVCLSFSFLLAGVPFQLQTHSNHLILKPARTDSILRKLTACASFKKKQRGMYCVVSACSEQVPFGGGVPAWSDPWTWSFRALCTFGTWGGVGGVTAREFLQPGPTLPLRPGVGFRRKGQQSLHNEDIVFHSPQAPSERVRKVLFFGPVWADHEN